MYGSRRGTLISVILITAFLLSHCSISVDEVHAHAAGRTFQAWAPAAPTINGVIDTTTEWKYAMSREFSVSGRAGPFT